VNTLELLVCHLSNVNESPENGMFVMPFWTKQLLKVDTYEAFLKKTIILYK